MKQKKLYVNMDSLIKYLIALCLIFIGIAIGRQMPSDKYVDITKQYDMDGYVYCWSRVYYGNGKAEQVCFTFRGINHCRKIEN